MRNAALRRTFFAAKELLMPEDKIATRRQEITIEQRQEIRRLCQEARVPDRSGEPISQDDYQRIVADLKEKARME
jgi:Zn-dependent peptidase ImmA (M78 family)